MTEHILDEADRALLRALPVLPDEKLMLIIDKLTRPDDQCKLSIEFNFHEPLVGCLLGLSYSRDEYYNLAHDNTDAWYGLELLAVNAFPLWVHTKVPFASVDDALPAEITDRMALILELEAFRRQLVTLRRCEVTVEDAIAAQELVPV